MHRRSMELYDKIVLSKGKGNIWKICTGKTDTTFNVFLFGFKHLQRQSKIVVLQYSIIESRQSSEFLQN
jgi:hypothetical protein